MQYNRGNLNRVDTRISKMYITMVPFAMSISTYMFSIWNRGIAKAWFYSGSFIDNLAFIALSATLSGGARSRSRAWFPHMEMEKK